MVEMCHIKGHEVVDFCDGKHINPGMLAKGEFDLLITDLVMPQKEGFETISEVRATLPELAIIVVSGGVQGKTLEYFEMAKMMGVHVTLKKPFESIEFFEAVESALGLKPDGG